MNTNKSDIKLGWGVVGMGGGISAGVRGGSKRRRIMKATRNYICIYIYIIYIIYTYEIAE